MVICMYENLQKRVVGVQGIPPGEGKEVTLPGLARMLSEHKFYLIPQTFITCIYYVAGILLAARNTVINRSRSFP